MTGLQNVDKVALSASSFLLMLLVQVHLARWTQTTSSVSFPFFTAPSPVSLSGFYESYCNNFGEGDNSMEAVGDLDRKLNTPLMLRIALSTKPILISALRVGRHDAMSATVSSSRPQNSSAVKFTENSVSIVEATEKINSHTLHQTSDQN